MTDWKLLVRGSLADRHLPPRREAEIVEELSQHLEDRYDELRARGIDADRASNEVEAELDATDLSAYMARLPRATEPAPVGGGSSGSLLGGLLQDLRFGARLIAKDRGAACVVVITLALAMAANTIVFGFTDLLLLRPLPLANIERLVAVYSIQSQNTDRQPNSVPDFIDLRSSSRTLEAASAMMRQTLSMTGAGEPRAINAAYVTANHFRVWGVSPIRGRTFLDGEDAPGHEGVAVLSHHFWKSQFNGAESALHQPLTFNGRSYTVVGVLTPAIEIGNIAETDVWLPLELDRSARRDELALMVFALRRPSASIEATQAELRGISEQLQKAYPATNAGRTWRVLSGRDATVGGLTWLILALLATVVGLVLVVACANVATVVLARASARQQEIAVRIALGATRARLVRQLVLENVLLGIASGGVGLLLAYGGLAAFKAFSTESYFQNLEINGNLLAFVLILSVAAPVIFGTGPALQASKPDLSEDLKSGGRGGAASARGGRSRSVLVVAQVGFALAVLIASGLIVRAAIAIEHVPLGVDGNGLLTLRVRFDPPNYTADDTRLRTIDAILDRLSAVPGVSAAAASRGLPLIDREPTRRFAIAGRPLPPPTDLPWAFEAATTGDYPRAAGLPILEGRMWRPDDRAAGWNVAVINREAVRRYWPSQPPLGDHVSMTDTDGRPTGEPLTIVGVVDNVIETPEAPPPPRLYRPLALRPMASVVFLVRAPGTPGLVATAVRDALRDQDRDLAVSDLRSFNDQIDAELRTQNLITAMFAGFASIGFVVAIAGIYGVTAFAVAQRRREIGVRLALGASAPGIARLMMGRSLRLIAIGGALGLLGGGALGSTMRSLLYGVPVTDPMTYAIVIAVFAIGGMTATYIPARRVMALDAASVLKRD